MCSNEGGSGVLKVGKGPKLFLKVSINEGLFKLVGSTLISSACVFTNSIKHHDDDDTSLSK